VEVSPDEKSLYVNESNHLNIWIYDIMDDGTIANKRLFKKFEDYGMDGMRCDVEGNLYVTRIGKGTVAILSPEGELLKEVVLKGDKPTNVAFGGDDGQTVYVTVADRGAIEAFRTEFPGRSFLLMKLWY
jgi:gluconolactonase